MPISSHQILVSLSDRSYPIEIGSGTLADIGQLLQERSLATHVVLISDSHVAPLYAKTVADAVASTTARVDTLVVDAGEQSKCTATADSLWRQMLELGADRKTVVVALGGGVV